MKDKVFKAENNEWHHGFQMTFENGCTISVVFGKGTYNDQGQTTAEVAAWNAIGDWMTWEEVYWKVYPSGESEVMARQTPDQVAMLISELVKLK